MSIRGNFLSCVRKGTHPHPKAFSPSEWRYAEEDLLLSTFSRRPHRLPKWLGDWRNFSNHPLQHLCFTVKELRPREVWWPAQDHRSQHRAEHRTQGSQLQTGDVPLCTTLQPWLSHRQPNRLEKVSTDIQSRADFHWSYILLGSPPPTKKKKRQSYTSFLLRAEQVPGKSSPNYSTHITDKARGCRSQPRRRGWQTQG